MDDRIAQLGSEVREINDGVAFVEKWKQSKNVNPHTFKEELKSLMMTLTNLETKAQNIKHQHYNRWLIVRKNLKSKRENLALINNELVSQLKPRNIPWQLRKYLSDTSCLYESDNEEKSVQTDEQKIEIENNKILQFASVDTQITTEEPSLWDWTKHIRYNNRWRVFGYYTLGMAVGVFIAYHCTPSVIIEDAVFQTAAVAQKPSVVGLRHRIPSPTMK